MCSLYLILVLFVSAALSQGPLLFPYPSSVSHGLQSASISPNSFTIETSSPSALLKQAIQRYVYILNKPILLCTLLKQRIAYCVRRSNITTHMQPAQHQPCAALHTTSPHSHPRHINNKSLKVPGTAIPFPNVCTSFSFTKLSRQCFLI
jgi:hypothetical protein